MTEEEATRLSLPTAIEGQSLAGSANTKDLQPQHMVLMKFIQRCWFENSGSSKQISLVQKSLLDALMLVGPYNWEAAYLKVILDEQVPSKDSAYLKHGNKVTSIILEDTRKLNVQLPKKLDVGQEHKLFKAPGKGSTKGTTADIPLEVPSSPLVEGSLLSLVKMKGKATKPRTEVRKIAPTIGRIPVVIPWEATVSSSSETVSTTVSASVPLSTASIPSISQTSVIPQETDDTYVPLTIFSDATTTTTLPSPRRRPQV